jgi:hypothetical protein
MKPMRGLSSRVAVVAVTSVAVTALATALAAFSLSIPDDNPGACESQSVDAPGQGCAKALVQLFEQGKEIFRFDTFGDEDYWGGKLQLHKAVAGAALGGVGPGVSPNTALTVAGLKVDVDALPGNLQAKLKQGKVDLDSPATTLALLELNAVVGVKGFFDKGGSLSSIGITCAVCHSTVDDSFAPGIGKRLDGWPNQDLNTGLIVSLAPNLAPMADQVLGASDPAAIDTLKKVLLSWGPGFYDAEVNIDAIGFRPDGKSAAVRIPAAYGHLGEDLHTWTGGFGNVTYWNAYVANLQMHGNGNFNDERFNNPAKYPAAVRGGFFKLRHNPDQVTSKLAPLHYYQPRSGETWRGGLQRRGQMRGVPHASALHRRRLQRAHAGRDMHRLLPGRPWADRGDRQHHGHAAAQRPLGAIEARLLPRRPFPDASGCGQPLQRLFQPRSVAR